MSRVLIASLLLTALGSVLLVSVVGVAHAPREHDMVNTRTDCPLMAHEESLCPMTALHHVALLRMLFEAALPGVVTLVLVLGAAVFIGFMRMKQCWHIRYRLPVLFRWRTSVLSHFSCRQYQDLFASGILHPKLYLQFLL
jgi:hypothetical protein